MPKIYLSPSTQEKNEYVNGGTEEYYMNLIADAMEPYLNASGILFTRNTPEMTAGSSIRESNEGDYDLHVALHSNASPEVRAGQVRGSDVYYSALSSRGKRAANIIAKNLKSIYPIPSLVRTLTTDYLGEVTKTRAPAVLIEFAFHDNVDDANWIKNNIDEIAANVVLSLTEYFGIPFITPQGVREGVVTTQGGNLNVRKNPSYTAEVIDSIPNGTVVKVTGTYGDFYIIEYNGKSGYAASRYITVY